MVMAEKTLTKPVEDEVVAAGAEEAEPKKAKPCLLYTSDAADE